MSAADDHSIEIEYDEYPHDSKNARERRNRQRDDDSDQEQGEQKGDEEIGQIELEDNRDEEFEGELGYSFVKAFRGETVGRKLKKEVFLSALLEFFGGIALICIANEANSNSAFLGFLEKHAYYSSMFRGSLGSLAAFSFLQSLVLFLLVRGWGIVVTNRILIGNVIRFTLGFQSMICVLSLWALIVMLAAMHSVDWRSSLEARSAYPLFIVVIVFLFPYMCKLFLHAMELWWLSDKVFEGGVILEPPPYLPSYDLSNLNAQDSVLMLFALPLAGCIQLADCLRASYVTIMRFICGERRRLGLRVARDEAQANAVESDTTNKRRKKSCIYRLCKTLIRCFSTLCCICLRCPHNISPSADKYAQRESEGGASKNGQLEHQLRELRDAKEEEIEAQRNGNKSEDINNGDGNQGHQNDREEEEEGHEEGEDGGEEESGDIESADPNAMKTSPTLSVQHFKALWTQLDTGGSFQCKLRAVPELRTLSDHMRKQGFHVVFGSNTSSSDLEMGVCNIRENGAGPWFLTRFIVSQQMFSAAMKCEDPSLIQQFVRKFALAKVLKIDTTSGGTD